MRRQLFIILGYGAVGIGLALGLHFGGANLSPLTPWLCGAAVVLAAGLIHLYLTVHREAAEVRSRLDAIDERHNTTLSEITAVRNHMSEWLAEVETTRSQQEDRLAELRELRVLVGQLAEKMGNAAPSPAKPARAAPPPPKPPKRGTGSAPASSQPKTKVRIPPPPTAHAELPPTAGPDPDPETAAQFDRIREALARARLDLTVQPVVRLPQRQTVYFEAFSRLRGRDGTPIPPESFYEIVEQAGFLPTLDSLSMQHCVEHIREDLSTGGAVPYFCNISGASLSDPGFINTFAAYFETNTELRRYLIFELSESDFASLDKAAIERLSRLTAVGYRLSLDTVETLEFDPTGLAARGVGFIKIAADALLPRPGAEPTIDIEALKDLMDGVNVALIVEKIENEDMLLELLDFRIDYGQGFLFGEPRKGG